MQSASARAPSRGRTVVLIILLLLAPTALAASGGAGGPGRALQPEDLERGVPVDALLTEGRGSWRVAERGAQPALSGSAPAGASALVSLVLERVEVFAFEADVRGGATLVFLVDGIESRRFTAASGRVAHDLALSPARHTLGWRFDALDATDSVQLRILGDTPVRSPVALSAGTLNLVCPERFVDLLIGWSLPLGEAAVNVSWNGEPVAARAQSWLSGDRVVTRLSVELPEGAAERSDHEVAVRVSHESLPADAVLRFVLSLADALPIAALPPAGWIYERQPTIALFAPGCLRDRVRLFVDDEEVTAKQGFVGFEYRLPRELAFNETLTYRFEIPLGGRVVTLGATVRGGLDVVEFDVSRGQLVLASASSVLTFENPEAPDELPPVHGEQRALLPRHLLGHVEVPDGARLRAHYAPLELRCSETPAGAACSPFGGGAPEYWTRAGILAPLEVTFPATKAESHGAKVALSGGKIVMHGAGQMAAASHFTAQARQEVPLPELLTEEDLREALAELDPEASVRVSAEAEASASA